MISVSDTIAAAGAPRTPGVAPVSFLSPAAGGGESITPPATLHADQTVLRIGGEDWLDVTLRLKWNMHSFFTLAKVLDDEQADAKDARHKPGEATKFVVLPGAGGQWTVHPHGHQMGKGGPQVSWVIERAGVRIGLVRQRRADPHETMPSGYVTITGEVLTPIGDAETVWNIVRRWIEDLGATIVDAKVSRVDLCVDLVDQPVSPLVEALRDGRVIRRTLKAEEHWEHNAVHRTGRRDTGMYLGSKKAGVALVRIYDKAEECRDLARRAYMIRERWGHDPECATRVEFQLRREFLTGAKCKKKSPDRPVISTVEDYFMHRAELAEYLTTKWVRFVDHGFDANHTDRAVNLPVWDRVIEAFRTWTGRAIKRTFRPLTRAECSVEDLTKQIRGCAESIIARVRIEVDDAADVLNVLNEELWKVISADPDLLDRIDAKRRLLVTEDDEAELCSVPF